MLIVRETNPPFLHLFLDSNPIPAIRGFPILEDANYDLFFSRFCNPPFITFSLFLVVATFEKSPKLVLSAVDLTGVKLALFLFLDFLRRRD